MILKRTPNPCSPGTIEYHAWEGGYAASQSDVLSALLGERPQNLGQERTHVRFPDAPLPPANNVGE